ncbi:Type II secretion system protein F [Rubripirellula tenax]|uniref:Type II secretion system protein F n=1 Tax=Rubripirellula tenax TaxID=2528015 RepID=A0A5C6FIB8_9BACT|nr:type II secretion system F family protein [Rubripirellula tenax]TWU60555.1 Type II secretion system protein F [Rubripirellula tenax]
MNQVHGRDPSQSPNASANRGSVESEMPKWLWRQFRRRSRMVLNSLQGPPYKMLASFCHDFGMCVRSTASIARSLELCLKPIRRSRLGALWIDAAEKVAGGSSIAEALASGEPRLPPFFLPVVRAGEMSGRLDEAFGFLESHCRLLAGPATALRKLWLFPVLIMLFGSAIKVLMHLGLGSVGGAITTLLVEAFSWVQLAVIVAVVLMTPVRYFFDQVRLAIPFVGALEREIAVHRFFRVMSLLYGVGGHRVEMMIQTAAKTVSNEAARSDLLQAGSAIENGATIAEAFRRVKMLTDDEKATIDVGEMSGVLERSFDQISNDTGSSMLAKLNIIQPILVRIVTAMVAMSIIGTAMGILLSA